MDPAGASTRDAEYAERLVRLQTARWKRWVDVQAPFRWNLRRLRPGFTLDVGCGIGRTLAHLQGHGVGVDTNEHCVRLARQRGFTAFTPGEFRRSAEYYRRDRFDAVLVAHVAEHMTEQEAATLLRHYEPLVRPGGRAILIAPQEAGFKSDPTHVQLMDFERLARVCRSAGFADERWFSFPFPRWAGRLFKYNEFIVVGRKPETAGPSGTTV